MVLPPPDVGIQAAPTPANRTLAATPERVTAQPGAAAPALDRADIKPLDVPAALQILIAEVREAFALLLIEAGDAAASGAAPGGAAPGGAAVSGAAAPANPESTATAARVLVALVLQSLPDTLDENAWGAALPRAEAALQAGVQSAIDAVGAWRDVSSMVVETTKASAQLALQVVGDEPQNPLWLRPEWLAMAPRLTRFWRRRRAIRRRLTDPDYDTATDWEQTDEYSR